MGEISVWYSLFREKFSAIAYTMGYSTDEGKDIVQQFFLELLQKNIPDNIDNPEAYLSTAFRRKLIDLHRSAERIKKNLHSVHSSTVEPSILENIEKIQADRDLVNKIAVAYKKMPARCRKVIYLKYYRGLTTDDIVIETGLSYQTVYNNLSKGIQYLRSDLAKSVSSVGIGVLLLLIH